MNRIAKIRKKKGITQSQLAEILNVKRGTISKYENGKLAISDKKLKELSEIFNVSVDYLIGKDKFSDRPASSVEGGKWIPVLGEVAAGIPIDAIENYIDQEEITPDMARNGNYFALQIKGDSMEPLILDHDTVIVRRQKDCNTGDIAVVIIGGEAATVKHIKKSREGITLIPENQIYKTMFYSNEEISNYPVCILGKVVECRRKF